MTTDRLPPQNLDAEVAVLGSMLLDASCIGEVEIADTDFYSPDHQAIFRSICRLNDSGKLDGKADLVLLADALRASGELDRIGGSGYLVSILERVPSSAMVNHYAGIVRDAAYRRRTIHACGEVARSSYDLSIPIDGEADNAESLKAIIDRELYGIAECDTRVRNLSVGDALAEVLAEAKGERQGRNVLLGWHEFDDLLGGLWAEQLFVIGGRPSMGKTTVALNMVLRLAMPHAFGSQRAPEPCLVCSIETGKSDIMRCAVSCVSKVDGTRLRRGLLPAADILTLQQWLPHFADAPLFVDDTPGMTWGHVRRTARRVKAMQGSLRAVVVDYLQLMGREASSNAENLTQEVGENAKQLKQIARELGCTIIALSQLSRATEARPDGVPRLSDLRQSGDVEQAADVVMLLYRYEKYHTDGMRRGELDGIIAKQRFGPTDTIPWALLASQFRVEDRVEQPPTQEVE